MFRNHQGGREASHHHGELYKDRVRRYWKARGYDLIADSKDDNITPDLIFRQAHEHGNIDIWIESKDTSLSRTDSDFIREFVTFIVEFQERSEENPFDLHIFARELEAVRKWEKIFKVSKQEEERVRKFHKRIKNEDEVSDVERDKFLSYSFEDFQHFVTETTTIHQMSPGKLEQATEDLEKSDRYDRDTFTEEREPINEREELEPNFAEIADPPEHIYIGNVDVANFHNGVRQRMDDTDPFRFESNKVYSLRPPEEFPHYIEAVTEMDTISPRSFDEWASQDDVSDLASSLLLREICRQMVERYEFDDCVAFKYLGDYFLMFEHETLEKERETVKERQVSRVFDEGSSRFVYHRTAQLDILRFNDDYFLTVLVKDHFTDNGGLYTLIRGDNKKRLHEHFNQNRYNNSQTYSRYRHWRDILGIHNRSVDKEGQEIGFRQVTEISIGKRPAESKKQIDKRDTDTVQRKLGEKFD